MLGLYIGQTLVLSEHEDKVQNRYKEKHTSQTLKGALIFDDDLPLKAALNDRTRLQFFKSSLTKTTSMTTSTSIKVEAKLNFASSCPVA